MKVKYWLLIILFIGAILRLGFLGDRPFDGDEGVVLQFSSQTNIKRTLRISQTDAHPPLAYLVSYFSYHYLGQTEFWTRFLPAIAGILLVYATYKLTKTYFPPKIALLTAFLIAISPHLIAFSQENRMYSYLTLFTISSLYFFSKTLKNKDNFYFLTLSLTNTLLVYTHHVGWIIIGAEVIFWLHSLTKNRKIFIPFLLSFSITFLLFLPILNPTIRQFQGRNQDQAIGISIKNSAQGLIKAIYRFGGGTWLKDNANQKYIYGTLFLVPLFITGYGLISSKEQTKYPARFLWLVIILCVLAGLFSQEIGKRAERTLLFLAPFYLIYTSIGIEKLWNRGKDVQKISGRGYLSRLFPILLILIFIFSLYQHYFVFNKRNGVNTIASFLGKRLSPQDAVYIKGSFFSGESIILRYYLNQSTPNYLKIPITTYYDEYKVGNLAYIRTKDERTEIKKILAQPDIKRVWFYDFSYQPHNVKGIKHKLGLDKENQPIVVWEVAS